MIRTLEGRAAAVRAAVVPDWLAEVVRPRPAPVPWPEMIRAVLAISVPLSVVLGAADRRHHPQAELRFGLRAGAAAGIGTVVGAVAGAVLLVLVHGEWLLIPFAVLAALLPYGRSRNYGLLAVFGTGQRLTANG